MNINIALLFPIHLGCEFLKLNHYRGSKHELKLFLLEEYFGVSYPFCDDGILVFDIFFIIWCLKTSRPESW